MSYYAAFLNNGAIILREFGLYKKAIQQVEETLEKRDFIGSSNFIVTIYLLSNLYLSARETDKMRKLLQTYMPELKKVNIMIPTSITSSLWKQPYSMIAVKKPDSGMNA